MLIAFYGLIKNNKKKQEEKIEVSQPGRLFSTNTWASTQPTSLPCLPVVQLRRLRLGRCAVLDTGRREADRKTDEEGSSI